MLAFGPDSGEGTARMYSGHDRIETRDKDLNARIIYGPRNVVTVVLSNINHTARRKIAGITPRVAGRGWARIPRGTGDDDEA